MLVIEGKNNQCRNDYVNKFFRIFAFQNKTPGGDRFEIYKTHKKKVNSFF